MAEEEALAERVREALLAIPGLAKRASTLRDGSLDLREAAQGASQEDLVAASALLHGQRSMEGRLRKERLPDLDAPYFAHLRVFIGRRQRDVLLGEVAYVDTRRGVTLSDYRGGIMGRVFFQYAQGEEYEEEEGGREVEGRVEARRLVVLNRGRPVEIHAPEGHLTRDAHGTWHRKRAAAVRVPLGTGVGRRFTEATPLRLDDTQRAAVELPRERPLLVLGDAGCGKTTVVLHRLAALVRGERNSAICGESGGAHGGGEGRVGMAGDARSLRGVTGLDPAAQALVVVPEEGLARLTERWLKALGQPQIPVAVFDRWVLDRARALVPGLPRRICRDAPSAVVRLKRHPALWGLIPRHVASLGKEIAERLDRTLATGRRVSALLAEEEPGSCLLARISRVEEALRAEQPGLAVLPVKEAFREARGRIQGIVPELRLFLGDHEVLSAAIRESQGELTLHMMNEALRHLRDQLAEPAQREFADVAPERRAALDHRGLDEGTPAELAGSIDLEDCALILALKRELLGPPSPKRCALRALVVDEAQDLAPVELAALGEACRKGCALSVAGDPAQQVDPTLGFHGWDVLVSALGQRDAAVVRLEISYRCPPSITRLAQVLRGGADGVLSASPGATSSPDARSSSFARSLSDARSPSFATSSSGASSESKPREESVLLSEVLTRGHLAALLVEGLRELVGREPHAHIAVICREAKTAIDCHAVLSAAMDVRLVLDGTFSFLPGVEVTTLSQVKGLEFHYVVLPDVTADTYPVTAEAARQLYVALTRTSAQAWLMHLGLPSPLLPSLHMSSR